MVMAAIVERFHASATAAHTVPVVLFIPDVTRWPPRQPPAYHDFREELRRRFPAMLVVDIAEHDFDVSRFNVGPHRGHASAYGNQVIAAVMETLLRRAGLRIPEESPEGGRRSTAAAEARPQG
jgi:hypothetical protein